MPKPKKATKETKKLSMKEAFESLKASNRASIVVGSKNDEKVTFRDWLWNYPENISSLFKKTSPISFMLVFLLLGFGLFTLFRSESFASMFNTRKSDIFVEGSVGAISTFNPLFTSQNPVDKDIQALVFEKFIKIGMDGKPIASIAKDWVVSKDGKTYDFTIDLTHKWQDGEPLTLEDIVFTFETAKKLSSDFGYDTIGSTLSGVVIDKISEDKLRFTLSETNSTFFEAVSVYIVPKHKLEDVSLQDFPFNSFAKYPLGSGPYKVYRSEPNVIYLSASEYYWVTPKIETIIYRLYQDYPSMEASFRNGMLDAIGGIDGGLMTFAEEYSGYKEYDLTIESRLRMIFFNVRKEKLEGKEIRNALNYITDKNKLLEKSSISGVPTYGPISKSNWAYSEDISKFEYDPVKAGEIFNGLGYTKNDKSGYYESSDKKILSFTISYYDNDLNNRLVNALRDLWKEEGVVLNLEPLSYTQLTQEIVATRNFDMLLYEVETTIDPDQYNLWHTLKTNYPDLNLSGYSYERVDILLEDGRRSTDINTRKDKYRLFQKYLTQDSPAMFLYHPTYTYIVKDSVYIPQIDNLAYPYQRFKDIAIWTK